jgi:predicted ATPase/serine phosphatase RsbU (regulator of sigma subunit)/GAF domain-containing protein/tRNA A-37 threonylcarbamoyl transferase component Bud32
MTAITTKTLSIHTTLYKSPKTTVALASRDNVDVLVKTTTNTFPTSQEIQMIRHEYNIAESLQHPNISQTIELIEEENKVIFVRAYAVGETLTNFFATKQTISLAEKLQIAIQITDAIAYIHSKNIIHKDINPNNIVINKADNSIQIIDFGIATKYLRESTELINLNQLEGTLDYISPEQTGRVNRSLDYRTDLYSLGIVLYRLFSGKLPFISEDSLELIHAHIAVTPEPPHFFNAEIPEVISEIILKLIEKNAEDRYQSGLGVLHDLQTCAESLATTSLVKPFAIARADFSTKLQIPQKLYGRESQRQELLDIYSRVSIDITAEVVFIKGISGVGKTSLINEIHKPMTENNGFFIKGKFDQLQRNIPYLALINAFDGFIDQLIAENDAKLEIWREKLLKALDVNANILLNLLPRLELILGEQAQIDAVTVAEGQSRLENVFTNFIKVIANEENPLCMFIDDLQWADPSSLKLIEILLQEPKGKALLFIGAYRDNEVDAAHPLLQTIKTIANQGVRISDIELQNLNLANITNLVNDTLQRKNIVATGELAKLIFDKTQGNAFFVNQFLNSLYSNNQLNFDIEQKKWVWDLQAIQALNKTDNVVDFVAKKLNNLPKEISTIISYASAIGNSFDLETIVAITDKDEESIQKYLDIALGEEILLKRKQTYYFVHDKVQQAAYSIVPADQKAAMHLKIATIWAKNTVPEQVENTIFTIANQYNFAIDAITSPEDKNTVIKYNLLAGKKALQGNAFSNANTYLLTGFHLIPKNSWEDNYTLLLDFATFLVETQYQNGNFDEAEYYANLIIENAKTPVEKAQVYNTLIVQYTLKQDFAKAITCAITGLSLLGVEVPTDENLEAAVGAGIGEVMQSLAGRKIADLLQQPDIEADIDRMTVKLLVNLAPTAFLLGKQLLWTYVIVKSTAISMKKGNMPESSTAYSSFGILSGAIFGDYASGYEYGKLAVGIAEKYKNLRIKSSSLFVVSCFLNPWTNSLKESFVLLQESVRSGVSSGELQFASYSAGNAMASLYHVGSTIKETIAHLNSNLAVIQKAQNFFAEGSILTTSILHHLLAEPNADSIEISYLKLSIEQIKNKYVAPENPLVLFTYHYSIALSNMYLGNTEQAFRELLVAETCIAVHNGTVFNVDFYCFMPIISAMITWLSKDETLIQTAETKLTTYMPKIEMLHKIAPQNFGQRYTIILAMNAAKNQDANTAMNLFDEAIDLAYKNGFMNDYAFFHELTAKYYGTIQRKKIKEIYLQEAYQQYIRWGAYAKVEALEIENSFILEKGTTGSMSKTKNTALRTTIVTETKQTQNIGTNDENFASQIDINSIVKANLALASEVVLDKLCETLMAVVIESVGANKGTLILKKQGEMLVFAEKIAKNDTKIHTNYTVKEATKNLLLPEEIINYTINSRKILVLDNAMLDEKFDKTVYIKKSLAKSVLCLPLIHQKELIGILYLENNLIAGAFTNKRLAMLNLLTSQITISVVNAVLYENLEEKVKDRTAKLSEAYDLIQRKNHDITSSINYAKRIQEAMLPSIESINAKVNSFVYFLPKDIVSGDFYWFAEKGDAIILVVADCTGHGVPGALMSMLGSEALNKAVHDLEVHQPNKILTELHESISLVLKQQETGSRDGMDIAVLSIHKKENKAYFAGAMNPLYYVQNKQLIEIKADKMPIGGQSVYTKREFTTHSIDISMPTMLYLTSDGFQDQFGGKDDKKYLTKNLRNFLLQIHEEEMPMQNQLLSKEFDTWKGKRQQIDDVLIVGVKI